MPTKIRLQRRGKKKRAFYHIVIADGRAPRDGRYIERIGTYNPVTRPAEINLNFDRALEWLQHGAQPTNSARAILSFKGVMLKHHLQKGVQKGAMTQEQADSKFNQWLADKEQKMQKATEEAESKEKEKIRERLDKEKEINEQRAREIQKKRQAEAEEKAKSQESEQGEESAEAEETAQAEETAEAEEPAQAEESSKAEESAGTEETAQEAQSEETGGQTSGEEEEKKSEE